MEIQYVRKDTLPELEEQVNAMAEFKWRPYERVIFLGESWLQALVRYEKPGTFAGAENATATHEVEFDILEDTVVDWPRA